jgi:hypothetical protein
MIRPPSGCDASQADTFGNGHERCSRAVHVDWFCQLPELPSVADSVALAVCHLALLAAVAPLEVIREDAQNGSTRTTIPGGPAAMEPVGKSPGCGEQERPPHVGRSNSLAR